MLKKSGLGETEQRVLLAAWRLGGEVRAVDLQGELRRRIGLRLTLSAIHYTLFRLEEKGMVASRLSDPIPVPGGKARRLFQLLPAGRLGLRRSHQEMQALWEGLDEKPAEGVEP